MIIYWNCDKNKEELGLNDDQLEKYLFYQKEDLSGLILALLEEEKT